MQLWHVFDRHIVQLQAGVQPHDLSLGWVQTQSASLHPVFDVGNARCEADNGGGGVVRWRTDVHCCRQHTRADGVDDERRRRTAPHCPQCTGRTTAVPERCLEGRRTALAVHWTAHRRSQSAM